MPTADQYPPIGVFLHVATLGRYEEVAHEVIHALMASPLYNAASLIEVNVVGEGPFDVPMGADRVKVIRRADSVAAYEHPTLAAIKRYGMETPGAAVLYLNCLGGRHVGHGWQIRQDWRAMLYFVLIERYEHCLAALIDHEVCGIDWSEQPMPHMTSNNWWATAAHVASLPDPEIGIERVKQADLSRFGPQWRENEMKCRHAGEFWLGMAEQTRPSSLLPLMKLGLPIAEYGNVPWWGLPGIRWLAVAKSEMTNQAALAHQMQFFLQRIYWVVRFALKDLKRTLKLWRPSRRG